MTPAEFKKKWSRYTGKESSAYQEHFTDLCRMLQHPTPVEADPSGEDFFCFQKGVIKEAGLLPLDERTGKPRKGWADVWKKDCFGWEYKGKHKNLEEAHDQLKLYRESLLNPPLMVCCDFDRYIIHTNFTGYEPKHHEFTNDHMDRPENIALLRRVFTDPYYLKPTLTTAEVTGELALQIAAIARSLQDRESVEFSSAKNRAALNVAQKKNLRIARFLNRITFCFFAEDTGLLPKNILSDIARASIDEPKFFAERLEELFAVMARGGAFGHHKIRHFNGHLFEDATVFELTEDEISKLAKASESDWQCIEPSIFGTLFERGLDPDQRAQLGAHFTSEPDIKTLVEPVLMAPLRAEWAALKGELADAYKKGRGTKADRDKLAAFLKKLSTITVLDPASGSGNFLYVALRLLLDLEKEVITFALQLDFKFQPRVSVQQLRALEINPYAFELAQVSVQIGYLQWRRENGFDNDRSPVLQNLDGFQNEDALLVPHFHSKARTLKAAQAGEHQGAEAFKFYTERQWPECDVIVGNPPFLGNKRLRTELGDAYTKAVFEAYGDRLPATSDFCCYWFEKARDLIAKGKCQRAGLLATTGSKQVSARQAFERIKESGKIFFAVSDRDWFDAGTAVRICMVGFGGRETTDTPMLDGVAVLDIHPDLSSGLDTTGKKYLFANAKLCFMGTTKVGDFDMPAEKARAIIKSRSPETYPNSDVLRPFRNGSDLVRENSDRWIVDFGVGRSKDSAGRYRLPFQHVVENVKEEREKNNRKTRAEHWWLLGETLPAFRKAISNLSRYIATSRVAKHRLFVWLDSVVLPDSKVIAFAFDDDYRFGVLQSRVHEVWTDAMCAMHGGERRTYNPTECFETFPFPFADDLPQAAPPVQPPPNPKPEPDRWYAENLAAKNYYMGKEEYVPAGGSAKTPDEHRAAIAACARELHEQREHWLHPLEWTVPGVLEFPGSAQGPWSRYIHQPDASGIGTVRYPRLEPRDADCAAQLKKRTLTNLYNERPAWLDLAHQKLDTAVAAAYGWPADLTDEQILENLLALNLARAAEEAKLATGKKRPRTTREKHADELI